MFPLLKTFGETVVRAFGHTYTLDLSELNGVTHKILLVGLLAILALGSLVRQFTAKSIGITALGSSLVLFWGGLYLKNERRLFHLCDSEGHLFNLYASDFRPFKNLLALMSGLCALAVVAFLTTRPTDLQKKPFVEQAQAMWWRIGASLAIAAMWWWSLSSGMHTITKFAQFGHVPSLEFPVHHAVQVGHPFSIKPSGGRYVGSFQTHWFRDATPLRIAPTDFQDWKLPIGSYTAEHTGDNEFPFRMTRTDPVRFSVETVFHVDAEKERGNPLFPLRVGDFWTYRRSGPVRKKQQLLQQFLRNTPASPPPLQKKSAPAVAPEPPLAAVRVSRSRIEDGLRIFEIVVSNPYADKSGDQLRTYSAVMMASETFLIPTSGSDAFDRKWWYPILSKVDSPAPKGEKLYPCLLRILAMEGECLCNEAPLDEKRQLPGLSRCIEHQYSSHSGENAIMLGLSLFTLGTVPFHERADSESYSGLLLQESASKPD